jgi:hypothetical protein
MGNRQLREHSVPQAPHVLRGMGLLHLSKNGEATRELTEKGATPD